jgi:hypothetical protein
MIIIVFHGMEIPIITISRTVIFQKYTPNQHHGRLFSMVYLAVSGMTAVSTALVGIFSKMITIHTVFLVFGVGGMITGFIGIINKSILNYH